jgi:RNA polymerase sigma-70 factor (ECF subfamily)
MRGEPNNEAEFLRLVEDNRPRLLRLCRVYAWNAADQDDLFQEILVQLWRSLPALREKAYGNTWLYRVALNTAITFVRKSTASTWATPTEDAELYRRADQNVARDAAQAGSPRIDDLYEAMDKLNRVDKALVTLFLEDFSYEEIGEVLGLSSSHVGVMLHRAKKKLSDFMKEAQ